MLCTECFGHVSFTLLLRKSSASLSDHWNGCPVDCYHHQHVGFSAHGCGPDSLPQCLHTGNTVGAAQFHEVDTQCHATKSGNGALSSRVDQFEWHQELGQFAKHCNHFQIVYEEHTRQKDEVLFKAFSNCFTCHPQRHQDEHKRDLSEWKSVAIWPVK